MTRSESFLDEGGGGQEVVQPVPSRPEEAGTPLAQSAVRVTCCGLQVDAVPRARTAGPGRTLSSEAEPRRREREREKEGVWWGGAPWGC